MSAEVRQSTQKRGARATPYWLPPEHRTMFVRRAQCLRAQYTISKVQCPLCSIQCSMSNVHYTIFDRHRMLHILKHWTLDIEYRIPEYLTSYIRHVSTELHLLHLPTEATTERIVQQDEPQISDLLLSNKEFKQLYFPETEGRHCAELAASRATDRHSDCSWNRTFHPLFPLRHSNHSRRYKCARLPYRGRRRRPVGFDVRLLSAHLPTG